MSMSPIQHQFPFTPPRRWRGGRIALLVAVVIIAFGGVSSWRRSAQGSSAQATPARAAVGADASVGTRSQAMTVYKGPECPCCDEWIALLRADGFQVEVVEQADMAPVKSRLGVPSAAESCHTATIGGYVIEGHVPTEDIARLLTERPAVVGIAVPGMPTGTPGMDGPKVPYKVVSFDRAGTLTTFAER